MQDARARAHVQVRDNPCQRGAMLARCRRCTGPRGVHRREPIKRAPEDLDRASDRERHSPVEGSPPPSMRWLLHAHRTQLLQCSFALLLPSLADSATMTHQHAHTAWPNPQSDQQRDAPATAQAASADGCAALAAGNVVATPPTRRPSLPSIGSSDASVPVQHAEIIGRDLRIVEWVTGRVTNRVARWAVPRPEPRLAIHRPTR